MAKSKSSPRAYKPAKPYPDFPLFPHATGRWGKKINQRIHFFGRWGHSKDGEIVPVDDVEASAVAAKLEFDRQWPYLKRGVAVPPSPADGEAAPITVKDLCDHFHHTKTTQVEDRDRSRRTIGRYLRAIEQILETLGRFTPLGTLTPTDFGKLRSKLAKGKHPTTLANDMRHIRIIMKYALTKGLVDRPIPMGDEFNLPERKQIRQAEQANRQKHGLRILSAEELRSILEALAGHGPHAQSQTPANVALSAMVLLGVNAGLGQADAANLEECHLDLKRAWLDMPRGKTATERRVPLWPETVAAIREAITVRPAAKSPEDTGCIFLTRFGGRWVKASPTGGVTDTIGESFSRLLTTMGLKRRGVSFYALRHVVETIGGRCRDQVAVDAVMGHTPLASDMSARYREAIEDERLRLVTDTVHKWLFGK